MASVPSPCSVQNRPEHGMARPLRSWHRTQKDIHPLGEGYVTGYRAIPTMNDPEKQASFLGNLVK